ncbi:MAG: type III pantothenate kinase [Fimbriimonas ginsengisoli]|uniref:Type III pantothenate kinase n=1 Tax=Fimbriimonas ginsengisoli TaxID=1005039 RepID=A0A931LQV7_FIMGI|nr:type III pantothenate kinase [Fimbriimonas ginsengisoli]
MLLAIDVGNTNSVYGVWDDHRWAGVWRRATAPEETEDQLAVWLRGLFELSSLEWHVDAVAVASVVPQMNQTLSLLSSRWLGVQARFLTSGDQVGIDVCYEPPAAVGADRIANALGALALVKPPVVVADFGTATTFDAIDAKGRYVGGAIMPGLMVSSQALAARTAKLPQIEFKAPDRAVGRNTVESLQAGLLLGYAGAVDALAARISKELGGATVIGTGGLSGLFEGLCAMIERFEPTLTLDGLRIASERMG